MRHAAAGGASGTGAPTAPRCPLLLVITLLSYKERSAAQHSAAHLGPLLLAVTLLSQAAQRSAAQHAQRTWAPSSSLSYSSSSSPASWLYSTWKLIQEPRLILALAALAMRPTPCTAQPGHCNPKKRAPASNLIQAAPPPSRATAQPRLQVAGVVAAQAAEQEPAVDDLLSHEEWRRVPCEEGWMEMRAPQGTPQRCCSALRSMPPLDSGLGCQGGSGKKADRQRAPAAARGRCWLAGGTAESTPTD